MKISSGGAFMRPNTSFVGTQILIEHQWSHLAVALKSSGGFYLSVDQFSGVISTTAFVGSNNYMHIYTSANLTPSSLFKLYQTYRLPGSSPALYGIQFLYENSYLNAVVSSPNRLQTVSLCTSNS